ncbi:MAG: dockerin type I repeat-containing protein [Ruminococcus sp.]|nr:dockerin type I repeat-containing protein [Ruminococcus sp.]
MKKTIHTLLTAAMFATSSAVAMPAIAEGGNAGRPVVDPVETIRLEDPNWNSGQQKNDPQVTATVTTQLINTTMTTTQTLYGVRLSQTTTSTIDPDKLVFLTTTTTMPLYGPAITAASMGDVNNDSSIDIFDMVALRKMLIQGYNDQNSSKYNADVNLDGKVNIADLVLLQNFLLGKIDRLNDAGPWAISPPTVIEQITTKPDWQNITTETTTTYEPVRDTIVSLYGITATQKVREEFINPNKTTETTAEKLPKEEK